MYDVADRPITGLNMKRCLALAILLLATVAVTPQTAPVLTPDVEKIHSHVGVLVGKRVAAVILLRDLSEITGNVIGLDYSAFYLNIGRYGKKASGHAVKILYTDVLFISSMKGYVSLIPHPKATAYGDWAELPKLPPNTFIEITGKNGEVTSGRFRSSSPDTLVIADKLSGAETTVPRSDVVFVHRVRYGFRDVSGGLAGGTRKGANIGKEVGKALGQITGPISGQPMGDGTGAVGAAMGAGIGALIGLVAGTASGTDSMKVLIYSK